jgi:F-type H+-transporting ATPase subunit a
MEAATAGTAPAAQQEDKGGSGLKWILYGVLAAMVFAAIGLYAAFGSEGQNQSYQPQNEFKLDPWITLKIGGLDMSINKAVLYLVLASALTAGTMIYIAKRMQQKPNLVQTAVEAAYDLTNNNITRGNMDKNMAAKWFPFVATLFFFIWFSNMLGYIPLPTNSEHTFNLFGLEIPAFALYAATANISIPLVLALVVFVSFNVEGIRAKGFIGYMKSLIPEGVNGPGAAPLFVLELVSNFMRLLSLSVRLFANILAGHLIILFMSGGLAVLLGLEVLGVFTLPAGVILFLFELGLVATLQAFIFATLSAIYLGGAVAEHH